MCAALYDHVEMAKLLVDAGADLEAKNSAGDTPLIIAINQNKLGIASALLDKGANPTITNKKRETPLTLLSKQVPKSQTYLALIEKLEAPAATSAAGPAKVSGEGSAAAPAKGSVEGSGGAPVPAEAEPPICRMVSESNDSSKLEDLLKSHDINAKNSEGNTPLIIAINQDKLGMASALLDKGAKPTITNQEGETPLTLLLKKESSSATYVELKSKLEAAEQKQTAPRSLSLWRIVSRFWGSSSQTQNAEQTGAPPAASGSTEAESTLDLQIVLKPGLIGQVAKLKEEPAGAEESKESYQEDLPETESPKAQTTQEELNPTASAEAKDNRKIGYIEDSEAEDSGEEDSRSEYSKAEDSTANMEISEAQSPTPANTFAAVVMHDHSLTDAFKTLLKDCAKTDDGIPEIRAQLISGKLQLNQGDRPEENMSEVDSLIASAVTRFELKPITIAGGTLEQQIAAIESAIDRGFTAITVDTTGIKENQEYQSLIDQTNKLKQFTGHKDVLEAIKKNPAGDSPKACLATMRDAFLKDSLAPNRASSLSR